MGVESWAMPSTARERDRKPSDAVRDRSEHDSVTAPPVTDGRARLSTKARSDGWRRRPFVVTCLFYKDPETFASERATQKFSYNTHECRFFDGRCPA